MKRFLSILLASMMILGCMAVTVSADVTFALETGETLAALATDATVDAGRKVMVTKIDGATYYRNGEAIPAADIVDGPKANTVALPVIEGGNVFQVVVGGEVSSNYVYVKGTKNTIDNEGSLDCEAGIDDYGTYRTAVVQDETVLDEVNADGSRSNILKNYYNYRAGSRENTDNWDSQFPSANAAVLSNDCYIKDFSSSVGTTTLNKGAFPLQIATKGTVSGANKFGMAGIGVNTDGSLYISHSADGGTIARTNVKGTTEDTGAFTTFGTWHNYAAVVYKNTMAVDYYVDDVLIAKTKPVRSDYDANSMIGATLASAGLCGKLADNASYFYFDNLVSATAATTATVAATPDQPFDIVPEGGEGGDDPVVPAVLVAGSIAEGITINRAALADAETTVAVVAVTAAGVPTVALSTSASNAVETFPVTGAARVFVWNWATLAPFCAPIQ